MSFYAVLYVFLPETPLTCPVEEEMQRVKACADLRPPPPVVYSGSTSRLLSVYRDAPV